MAEWVQRSKNVYTTEELRDFEQYVAQAGGRIVGVTGGSDERTGVLVTYLLPR